ncbi:polyprenyl synthetase family protein [Microterricola pindariensis]|uniref:polyprenyl synthetase family protein n=1 Tax=Microterricola pindariensis TaxID=478010 RepID=UPI000CEBA9FE|nr:polyprenyl synthetase family protein [Microterricola pindariensis]
MTIVMTRFVTVEDAARIEGVLAGHWQKRRAAAEAFGEDYSRLWAAIERSAHGGKLLRPALVLCAYEELSVDAAPRRGAAVELAAAFELLHTAFLLHDDVIDNDFVRRGQSNLAGERFDEGVAAGLATANAARWAQASAILAGDLLIHDAQSMVARLAVPEPVRLGLLDLLDAAVFASAAGELSDVGLSAGAVSPEVPAVLDMTRWKTAPYSFAAPLRAGAVLAGAPAELGLLLEQFGGLIGTAFQLRDDVLGVFGDEQLTGKSTIGDAREGKMTAMMAFARTTASWAELRQLIGPGGPGDIDRVRALLLDSGALGYAERLIADLVAEALALLEQPLVPAGLRTELAELAHRAAVRVS